jgi:hypothetical protein
MRLDITGAMTFANITTAPVNDPMAIASVRNAKRQMAGLRHNLFLVLFGPARKG